MRGKKYIDKILPDIYNVDGSEEEILETYRQIRDELKEWLRAEFGNEKI